MRRTSLSILILLAIATGGASADDRELVTEESFLAAVDATHPAARALAGDLGAARAARLRSSMLEDPRLEFGREAPDDLAQETTWGLSWTPPIDGRRSGSIRVAEAEVEIETYRLEVGLLDVRTAAREAYAAWSTGVTRAVILAEQEGRLSELSRRMRNRAEAGEESRLSAERMDIARRGSGISLSRARAAEAVSRASAAAWLAQGADGDSRGVPALPELPEVPPEISGGLDETVATAPRVRAAAAGRERAEELGRLGRKVVEAPELLLGWKSIDDDPAAGGASFEGPIFGFGWSLPVFDRRRADRLAAESELAAAAAREEWETRRAHGELAGALAAYVELRAAALRAETELDGLADLERAAVAGFEAGESTVTDLLDTLDAVVEARLAALDLYDAALAAHRRLERAAGRPLIAGDPS